ncbi:MAG TPA: asparagine synthase (glutamine-hydrolyzing) [Terriglobales bacterium]|nr:asparagine synthase (glutamine-hydrolyzing) [Terriglobales bacterium]
MCGIAGIVDSGKGATVDREIIHQMCERIVHRGPDDEGIYVHNGAGLGMRRLSIIDLSGGHQPIHNEDETIWVVFNGEIYNFLELRRDLEHRGHRFYTNTDTEVIVHLYEELGAACVQELRGMFAIAVYDEKKKKLLLARDRLGIKPLHYAVENGQLLFGSEIKAILAASPALREINSDGLLQYVQCGYIPAPSTAFAKISKLRPGHTLEFERGSATTRQYWDLPNFSTSNPVSEEECLYEMEQRLTEAVRIRLIADVPLGALLSGGVDSSIVVGLMARASSGPVKTFSIGFEDAGFNETPYARAVARHFGTEHHEFTIRPNIHEVLHYLTTFLDEPFGDSSMLPTYLVSRLARQFVKVVLSGDGGDELFAGYEHYQMQMARQPFNWIPRWAGSLYRETIFPLLPQGTRGRRFLYDISLPWPDRALNALTFRSDLSGRDSILSGDLRRLAENGSDPLRTFKEYLGKAANFEPLSQLLYLDTKTYLPADILTKVDRMSMATSLEARVPLLDHLFVEWAVSLPENLKLSGKKPKYILRKFAKRIGIPPEVLDRRKQGFAMPLVHWIRNELKQDFVQLLLEPKTVQRGYFDRKALSGMLEEHVRGRRDHSGKLWRLLAFELWCRNFLESSYEAGRAKEPDIDFQESGNSLNHEAYV